MLSQADAQLATRDPEIPGLACVLDAEALASGLRAALPGSAIPAVEISYARYKPATNCLVGVRLGAGVAYAKAYRRGDGDKAAKTVTAARVHGPWGPGAVRIGEEVVVSFFPNDRKLAIGRGLADPERRRSFLRRVLPGRPDAWEGEVRAVRYKPERRFVARVEGRDGPVALLRCYDAGDFARAAAAARAFTSNERVRVAQLLGVSERHRALALEWLDAGPLPVRLEHATCSPGAFTAVGEALARLHAQPAPTLVPLEREEEVMQLSPTADAVAAVVPHLADDARSLAAEIGSALRQLPPLRLPIHGDFSADQVVLTGDRVAIIDYDAARLGDPASDLGLFRATLLADVLRGALPTAEGERRTIALLDGYRAESGDAGDAMARLGLYTAMWLLRLAIEPFRYRVPEWPMRIEAILRCASQWWRP